MSFLMFSASFTMANLAFRLLTYVELISVSGDTRAHGVHAHAHVHMHMFLSFPSTVCQEDALVPAECSWLPR